MEIEDVDLRTVIVAALESRTKWSALCNFARKVMLAKETAERERREQISCPVHRQRPPPDPPPSTSQGQV